ncbi:hypothetical protein HBI84_048840 [Parastagonospora nodorum]|nr:hypothetical protein HBI84_048840 [Parastagonospora nodorum]
MGPSTSLFSRTRPSRSTPKKIRGFLSLPGEVRNQIYACYFESQFRCEIASKGANFHPPKPKTVKLWAGSYSTKSPTLQHTSSTKEDTPLTIRVSRPLCKYTIVRGIQTNWLASLFAVNLVCKQLHAETLPFLYQNTVFVFDAPKRILSFLGVVSNSKLAYITKLQLYYTTYGSPRMAADGVWQSKHRQSWLRACTAASKKLVSLQSLRIWICVLDSPLRCNLREAWVLPLLQFRRLTRDTQTLKAVDIDFRTGLSGFSFANQPLRHASEDLHRLFGQAIRLAILGAKEEVAMKGFNEAWEGEHEMWQYHLGYGKTGW